MVNTFHFDSLFASRLRRNCKRSPTASSQWTYIPPSPGSLVRDTMARFEKDPFLIPLLLPTRLSFFEYSSIFLRCPSHHNSLANFYGQVFLWDYETGNMVKSFDICELPVRCAKALHSFATFSQSSLTHLPLIIPRKQWFITALDDMQIRIFNYNTVSSSHLSCSSREHLTEYLIRSCFSL